MTHTNTTEHYINFYGDQLLVIADEQQIRHVTIKPICEALKLAHQVQERKLRADPTFSWNHMVTTGTDGKKYKMLCLPIEQINGWLFTINPNKVKSESRERLIIYRKECVQVLSQHFMPQGGSPSELAALASRFDMRFQRIENIVSGQQDELNELRALLQIVWTDKDEVEIRDLLHQVHLKTGQDKRAICGHVRRSLGISRMYDSTVALQVKNILRNLLGTGVLGVVKDDS